MTPFARAAWAAIKDCEGVVALMEPYGGDKLTVVLDAPPFEKRFRYAVYEALLPVYTAHAGAATSTGLRLVNPNEYLEAGGSLEGVLPDLCEVAAKPFAWAALGDKIAAAEAKRKGGRDATR